MTLSAETEDTILEVPDRDPDDCVRNLIVLSDFFNLLILEHCFTIKITENLTFLDYLAAKKVCSSKKVLGKQQLANYPHCTHHLMIEFAAFAFIFAKAVNNNITA